MPTSDVLMCAAVALATSLAVHVTLLHYQRQQQQKKQQPQAPATANPPKQQPVATPPPPLEHVDLRSLPPDLVPTCLRVDAFVAPEHQAAFAHAALFRGCAHVFATLDAIHAYALRFFEESEWLRASDVNAHITVLQSSMQRGPDGRCLDDSDDDGASDNDDDADCRASTSHRRNRSQWRLPECVDPTDDTEILLFPGVNPLTFAPDKIVNLPSPPENSLSSSNNRTGKTPLASPRVHHSPTGRRYSYGRASFSAEAAEVEEVRPPKKQIVILPGAVVLGGTFDVSDGSVYIGKNVRIEPNVFIKGPAIIGDGSTLRSGAYIRGDVITGQGVVLRGELKNALLLDHAELCHPGYCGDSICGFRSHFGNQVTTANLNLFSSSSSGNLTIDVDGKRYDTGRRKIGVILGDHSQLGCSAVTDPCTLLLPNTVAYPLSRLRKGVYGPNQIIKNKPMEHGVLEIAPLRQASD